MIPRSIYKRVECYCDHVNKLVVTTPLPYGGLGEGLLLLVQRPSEAVLGILHLKTEGREVVAYLI
jgi:hypothetical protein